MFITLIQINVIYNPIFAGVHSLRSMSSKVACIHIYIRVNGIMNAMFEHVNSLRLTIGYLAFH